MVKRLEAIYEEGVLKPFEPLPFADHQQVHITVSDEGPPAVDAKHVSELRWIEDHRGEFAGKWVALEGSLLLGHGEDPRGVLEEARKAGVASPLLVHLPSGPELPFAGW